jgi:hypothetical protein
MIEWLRRNNELHGWAMLTLTAFVYLGQGGRAYIANTMDWIIQFGFGGTAGAAAAAKAYGKLPWNFKFLIGLVSDNLPIFGYNVKPWMVLACVAGLGGQISYAFEQITPSIGPLTIAYTVVQYYGATVDCLADALVVKNGRHDEEDSASGLQSLSWFSYGVGAALFTFVGSQLSTDETQEDNVSVSGSRLFNKIMILFPASLLVFIFFLREDKSKFSPSLRGFFQQLVRLFVALFSPPFLVLRVAIWIIIGNGSQIYLVSGTSTFNTDYLGISPNIQGYIDICAYLGLSIGVVVYYKFFRYTSFRTIFFFSQLLTAVIYMSDYVLVKRWNKAIGLPDIPFLIASTAFTEVIGRLNSMPFLVMAGQLCPENMEATFFAMLMSISNQGSTLSEFLGAAVLEAYKVEKDSYDGLPTAILIRSGSVLCALLFIWLLPNTSALNPTNVETLNPTNPYIIKVLKFADMYHPEKREAVQYDTKAEEKV